MNGSLHSHTWAVAREMLLDLDLDLEGDGGGVAADGRAVETSESSCGFAMSLPPWIELHWGRHCLRYRLKT